MNKKLQNRLRLFTFCLISTSFNTLLIGQVPSDLMDNCNQWKITYPTGNEDKTLCGEQNNEFFFVNNTNDAIVFRAPIRNDNGTTPNSSYIRSELREREPDGSKDVYWTTTGKHMLYVKQAITHLPIIKPHLVATQIHGDKSAGIDDAMVMRLEGSHMFLSFNGGKLREDLTVTNNYVLGTIHEVIFLVEDDKHYCYYSEDGNLLNAYNNGNADTYLIKDGSNNHVMDLNYDQSYFKVGNYTQSNPDREGDETDNPENYGEVLVYGFKVKHGTDNNGNISVTSVSLSPATTDVAIDATKQLSATVKPIGATNQEVTYTSSNPSIATVNPNTGLVTGVALGETTITVSTNDGNKTDTSIITVVSAPVVITNLALNKPITGTGTLDKDNYIENLVDGITATRWSVSGYPQTAIVDLGAVYGLGSTELVCHDSRDYQYTISVSNTENGNYTQIVDRSQNTTPGTEAEPIKDELTNVSGRFVKLEITGAGDYNGSWVSLTEFRVFEAISLSNENATLDKNVSIWLDPTSNTLNIHGNTNLKTLNVYNLLGKQIITKSIETNSMDLPNLNSGLYIFKFSNENKTINKRIVVK